MADPLGTIDTTGIMDGAAAGAAGANNGLWTLIAARRQAQILAEAQRRYDAQQAQQAEENSYQRRRLEQADARQAALDARNDRSARDAENKATLGQITARPGAMLSGDQLQQLGVGPDSPLRNTVFASAPEMFATRRFSGYAGTPGTTTATKGAMNVEDTPGVGPNMFRVTPTLGDDLKQQAADLAQQKADITKALGEAKNENERQHWANMLDVANQRISAAQDRAAAAEGRTTQKDDDAHAIADAIIEGSQPPDLSRLYGAGAPVRAALARKGYNLTKATEDWNATSKYLATLNGQQQTRIRQAVDFTDESLGQVESLAQQWKSGGLGPLSRARLTLASQGALGPDAQSLATRFQSQIADVTSELATVYKGGNSSTDESLALAAKNLQADWSEKALLDNVAQIRTNLGYRRNSLKSAGVAGASAGNPYAPQTTAPGSAAAPPKGRQYDWDPVKGVMVARP